MARATRSAPGVAGRRRPQRVPAGTGGGGAESLFVVSDSAAFDSTAGRWVSARRDTLRAWRLEPEGGSADSVFGGWVDAAGRFVDASYGGGYRLRRTSYEEAALNWRHAGRDSTGR